MKDSVKLLLALAVLAVALFGQDAAPAPTLTPAEKVAQYEKAIPLILKQRSEADAMVRDLQLQLALLASEVESLKKQLAEAHAKLADLTKPKDAPKTASATGSTKTTAPKS